MLVKSHCSFLRGRLLLSHHPFLLGYLFLSHFCIKEYVIRVLEFPFSLHTEPVVIEGIARFPFGHLLHERHVDFRPEAADDVHIIRQFAVREKANLLQGVKVSNEFLKAAVRFRYNLKNIFMYRQEF